HSPLIPVHPLIADGQVILVGHRSVQALALPPVRSRPTRAEIKRHGPVVLWSFPPFSTMELGAARSPSDLFPAFATAADGVLVLPFYDTDNVQGGDLGETPEKEAVVSLSLEEEGKKLDQRGGLDPLYDSEGAFDEVTFSGAPLCVGSRVYVTGTRSKHRVETHAFCFDASRGPGRLRPLWRTKVCLGSGVRQPIWRDYPVTSPRVDASSPAMRNGILHLCSNTGAVAALDAETGEILWVHVYEQAERNARLYPGEMTTLATWFVNPPMLDHRLLYVAPLDADKLYTYHQRPDIENAYVVHGAFTRREVQTGFDPEYVLGVRDGLVFIAGSSLARGERPLFAVKSEPAHDRDQQRILWRAAIEEDEPRGRGVVAGDAIYFPTRKGIYRVSVSDGKAEKIVSPASPDVFDALSRIDVTDPEKVIGNLAVAGPWLVSASEEMVCLFGPPPVEDPVIEKEEGEKDD
ncbi:MAG: PQQ-binding-like beta-propeller repeat protein, partial [Planctomycetota bacterium]